MDNLIYARMFRIRTLGLLVVVMLLISACQSSKRQFVSGTIKDYTKLAGCSYVIELDNGEKLEPVNFGEFDSSPEDGKRVRLEYREEVNIATNCNVGKVVIITKYEVAD